MFRGRAWPLVAACAAAAALPDADFLLPMRHRGPSHGLGTALLAGVAAFAWLKLRSSRDGFRISCAIAAAYATHTLFDWLGADSSSPRGLMALWPFTDAYFISDLDLFNSVDRRYWLEGFWRRTAVSLARELAILAPITAFAWWFRHRLPEPGVRARISHSGRARNSSSDPEG